jgi:ATP-dependent Clp protease ATP-binding subunit ClpC
MAILDFFKKQSTNNNQGEQVTTSQPVVKQTVTNEQTVSRTQSYSGIGNPPSGQAYSGIGNPPAQKVVSNQSSVISNQQSAVSNQQNTDKLATDNRKLTTDSLKSNIDQKKRQDLDLMTHLTQRSNRVFIAASAKAKELQNDFVDSEHLLHGLLTDSEIYKFFTEVKILPQIIEQELTKVYKKGASKNSPQFSPRVKRILEKALILARKLGFDFISPEHILLSLYEEGEGLGAQILTKLGLKKEDLNKKIIGKKEGFKKEGEAQRTKSILEQFTVDLTAKAGQGQLDPVVERSKVIERVIHILSRRTKNNPALVGEAGVGKTAIVEGLAQKIVKKEVPEPLLNKKVLQLDLMSIIAGASHRGEFEERMKNLIEEVKNSRGQIILFIDEIHNLVGAGAGGEGALDASNFLKPSLARGELQVIGATTLTEYRKYIEKDPALERRFQPVFVPEPTEEEAIKMLKAIRDKYEAFHRVKIPDEAVESAVKLSKRYVGDRFLPDKAVDLIDEAASAVRLPLISLPEEIRSLEERIAQLKQEIAEAEKTANRVKINILKPKVENLEIEIKEKQEEYKTKKGQTTSSVTAEIIKDVVSHWTGIPVSKITESEIEKLCKLEQIMHQRLIDQEIAVSAVAEAVRRGRAGLKSTKRPTGSFVFLGPTGVGKTELAKTLAEVLFGQEEAVVRFDMTEYMEKHEVAKLLGAPPGYVGYEEGGKLTEAVRRKPYSVVLFDEVEKAHPDIFNILLQILDDGRLTDNKGHTISFKNTVVICTSNIGTGLIQDEILKTGKMETEEPATISTYSFSPRGREILTIMGKVFERESVSNGDPQGDWKNQMLLDYFAGQKIESEDQKQDEIEFPIQGFDTHLISPKGVEMITKKDLLYYRTSTTLKIWKVVNLIDYFKEAVVINALPDAPEQQLPTVKLKTHAMSSDEWEIVTSKDRFWRRKEGNNNWETGSLRDYFKGQTAEEAPNSNDNNKNQKEAKPDKTKKTQVEKEVVFPINYWDIHVFSPDGRELIIMGDKMWLRSSQEKNWRITTVKEYFRKNFPLDKELEEKKKIEEELDKNQYLRIKNKVMEELRKFFRPELINRFDEVIIFEPLKYQHMIKIAELQMKALKKLLEEQDIGLSWTKASIKEIVRVGFDPVFGARPLRRAIQKLIENPISSLIIERKVKEGDQIVVNFDGENFIFNIEKVELVPAGELTKNVIKNFFCESCGQSFQTQTAPNSTVVCPKCASKEVQEELEHKEEKLEKKDVSKETPIKTTDNQTITTQGSQQFANV